MKPMHGSVSLPSIDELAADYIILWRSGGNVQNSDEYLQCRSIIEEIFRRIGYENARELIKKTSETYALLTGEPTNPSPPL